MRRKGISLIVLVITIVVIIVLAAAVILSLGNNNPIESAKQAAREQEKADLIDDINLCVTQKLLEDNTSIEKYLNNIPNATVEKVNSDAFYVTRGSTTFTVDNNGKYETSKVNIWDGTSVTEPTNKTENEIHITSCAEFKWLADQVNNEGQTFEGKTIYLDSDLDFGARAQNNNWETAENEALEWTPIGPSSSQLLKATFNGNNHFVKGIYVNREANFNGIFGNSYTIENLTIKDSYIKGAMWIAGIVGSLRSGKVENCHNLNTTVILIEGNYCAVGGVVGQNSGSVLSCSNSGNIIGYGNYIGYSYAGGVVGLTYEIVDNCYNTGSVTGNGNCIGGVVGNAYTSSQVTNCYNTGSVTGNGQRTGGVVGNANPSSQIINCYNTGKVVGENVNTGGVVGITFGIVDNCYNAGTVKGNVEKTGGIVGQVSCLDSDNTVKGTLRNSYNIGKVEERGQKIGGITGSNSGTVENCYFLDTSYSVGVGYTDEDTVKNEFAVKSESEMKDISFVELLGSSNWEIQGGKNRGYPVLK